jgi:hypothetical protein
VLPNKWPSQNLFITGAGHGDDEEHRRGDMQRSGHIVRLFIGLLSFVACSCSNSSKLAGFQPHRQVKNGGKVPFTFLF